MSDASGLATLVLVFSFLFNPASIGGKIAKAVVAYRSVIAATTQEPTP